jgi:hypothetical protein
MNGLLSHEQMILLIDSQHVSAPIGLNEMILEEYTNDEEMRIIPQESPDDGISESKYVASRSTKHLVV